MPKEYHKNPRTLSEKQFKNLQRDIHDLGDLGCIVHNLNTDEIISGNQRCKIIKPTKDNIELVESFDAPTSTGTIAVGYINYNGERWPYRQVRWDEKTAERACIVANKAGGTFDFDILANSFDTEALVEYGFEPFELGMGDIPEDEEENQPKQKEKDSTHICPNCQHEFID